MTPLDPLGPEIQAFRGAMLEFYGEFGRDLPWRRSGDPYRVLVSEVMLQQTRVDTVIPYFERWMERFPDAESLAEAGTEEVLRIWQGLGYYSRARNLHRAVQEVQARYGGRIPEDPDELRTLPGVGPYTAGAVSSIAFGIPAPAVDGNVRRVLARLMDERAPSPSRLRSWAATLVDPNRPGEFNQALMELGSTICTPRAPGCDTCPVAEYCLARNRGTQEARPEARSRSRVRRATEAVVALLDGAWAGAGDGVGDGVRDGVGDGAGDGAGGRERVLMRRRPDDGLLGGMWELPGVTVEEPESPREAAVRLSGELGGTAEGSIEGGPTLCRTLEPFDHAFTHLRVCYHPFVFRVERAAPTEAVHPELRGVGDTLRWVAPTELERLPLPAAQARILSSLGLRDEATAS